MIRTLFAAFFVLLAASAFAQEKMEVKTVASIILMEKVCPKDERTAAIVDRLVASAARDQKLTQDDVRAQATVMANMLASMMEGEPKQAEFCAQAKPIIDEASAAFQAESAEKPRFSQTVLSNKFKLLIEFAIIFAVGAAIGWIVGFIYKWVSGKNVNASRFWIPGWGIGFILLSRWLVIVANS